MGSQIVHGRLDSERGSYRAYISGFVLSVGLTLIAYFAAVRHTISGKSLMAALLGLAVVQLFVQLFFFLHIGRETKPRWRLLMLFLAIFVVLIVVLGSLWIMYNLSYRMMPDAINKYMLDQASGGL